MATTSSLTPSLRSVRSADTRRYLSVGLHRAITRSRGQMACVECDDHVHRDITTMITRSRGQMACVECDG